MPVIQIDPVPASRPRVMKNGITFYAEPYKSFKKRLKDEVAKLPIIGGGPITQPVGLVVVFRVRRPKVTKLSCPRPDIDNYAKALMDALNGTVLADDTQVVKLTATKEWAEPGEDGSIAFKITSPTD